MANPHVNKANKYARDVVAGKIDACKWVKLSCQRHLDGMAQEKKKSYPYKLDRKKAESVCNFGELLVHVKGKWAQKREHIKLEPWQCFILVNVFGWVRKSDNLRKYREMYAEVPRKNGKSVLGAIIGLHMLLADKEEGAEVYSGATSEKQALEVFTPAKNMANRTPNLKDHYAIEINAKNLFHPQTLSRFEPIIGKPGDGASPHCSVVDEYHEHQTPDLYDTMLTGMGAREQPLQAVITTAGTNLAGPCYDKRNQVTKVLEGVFEDDQLFAVIYTVDEKDDWTDIKVWKKANPNYGVSVFADFLKARLSEATQRASRQNIIRCKHLNQWMNAGEAWINMVKWDACKDKSLNIEQFYGKRCFLAMDLANKIDIVALVALFPDEETPVAFGKYYLPEETVRLPENQHYQQWEAEGVLTVTGGARTDFHTVEDDIKWFSERFNVQGLGFDQKEASYLVQNIEEWASFPCVEISQSPAEISEPMKELEAMIEAGEIRHVGDKILTWMMSNVIKKKGRGSGEIKAYFPTKERASQKIDGAVCLIMCVKMAKSLVVSPEPRVTVL